MRSTILLLTLVACAGVAPPSMPAQAPGAARRELTLAEALSQTRLGNPELALARTELSAARGRSRSASARLWPQVDLAFGYTRSTDPVFAFGTKLRQARFAAADLDLDRLNDPGAIEDWSLAVGVQWSVLDPRRWAASSSASQQAAAEAWTAARRRESAELTTRVLYYAAVAADAHLASAGARLAAAQATADLFRRRRQRGVTTEADLLQAEAELSAAESRRWEAERASVDALQRLGLHLGWAPDTIPQPIDTLTAPEPFDDPSFRAEARSDVRALAAALGASGSALSAAKMAFVPGLDAFAQYATHSSRAFSGDGDDWAVGLSLRWSAFSGFGRFGELERARANRQGARIQYEAAVREARSEVDRSRRAVRSAIASVEASGAASRAADTGLALMRRRFEEGLATAAELLQAEARATAMRELAIDALARYHIAAARFEFASTQIEE